MSSSIRASSTKTKPSRHVRFGEDGEIEIAGHGGLRASDIPAENISEEEYDGDEELADGDEEEYSDENGEEEYSDGEDLGEDMAIGLVPHIQARLLARYIRGELDGYPPFFWK